MPKPVIHRNKVKSEKVLEEAMGVCPVQVFAKEKGKIVVKNPGNCIGCRACESVCQNGEITVED